jgi:hypothetical protein
MALMSKVSSLLQLNVKAFESTVNFFYMLHNINYLIILKIL